jgi:N utilization substance protein B
LARTGSGARARQRARELLVKALYQWQLAGHDFDELLSQFSDAPEYLRADQQYFKELLGLVLANTDALDRTIERYAARGLKQLDEVGRAILLLALAELAYRPDVPKRVVINEGVELAKRYGPTDSFRFVNAVLDKAANEVAE